MTTEEVGEALAPWFAAAPRPRRARVVELRRHAEGFSWETYTLALTLRRTGEPRARGYAVRVEPHDGLLAPYDIDGQYRLHAAIVDHSDVPMPALTGSSTTTTCSGCRSS